MINLPRSVRTGEPVLDNQLSEVRLALTQIADALATGSRSWVQGWFEIDVGASQTAKIVDGRGPYNPGVGGQPPVAWVPARPGSITAISAVLSVVAAGSSITIQVFVNGVATAADMLIPVDGDRGYATFEAGLATFQAGDAIDVRFTTPAAWTATGAELVADFEVTT